MVVVVEKYKAELFKLLKEELGNLSIGHQFDLKRISKIKSLCHTIFYLKLSDSEDTPYSLTH